MTEPQLLLNKAARTIQSAERLLRDGDTDFSASTIYYACFYIAEALLLTRGLHFARHGQVHAQYGFHFARTKLLDPAFHRLLDDAFELRQAADYQVEVTIDPEVVQGLIEGTRRFLAAAFRYLEELPAAEGGEHAEDCRPLSMEPNYNGAAMDTLPNHIREVLLKLEAGLKALYGNRFRGLLLYGSYARGEAWEGSDVDLLLLLKGPVNPAREIIASEVVTYPLSLDSGLLLAVMPADYDAYQRSEGIFYSTIREDAVPVGA
jgi:uncharacterized protein (UPF0332 family)